MIFIKYLKSHIQPSGQRKAKGLYLCQCGNFFSAICNNVRRGNTTSCGCVAKGIRTTHGKYLSSEYVSWDKMIQRCLNAEDPAYKDYGGRGIKVCDSWLNSFEDFYKDMGDKPEGYSLDRILVDGNYEKINCRWACATTQAYNKRFSKKNTSGKTGVSWSKSKCCWVAYINYKGKRIVLGQFSDFQKAVEVREKAEIDYYGFNKK